MALVVSIAKRQRITLTSHKDMFEDAKIPTDFANYVERLRNSVAQEQNVFS